MKQYDSIDFADIWFQNYSFRLAEDPDRVHWIFEYKEGRLLGYCLVDGELVRREFAYAHLQKRRMSYPHDLAAKRFFIVPNEFIPGCNLSDAEIAGFVREHTADSFLYQRHFWRYKVRVYWQKLRCRVYF